MLKYGLLSLLCLSLSAESFYYENGKKVTVKKISDSRANSSTIYYKNSLGKKIGVKNEIIFKCVEGKECLSIVKRYNLKDISNLSNDIYIAKVSKGSDIFEISQKLYLENNIEFANPNFVKKRYRR